MAKRYHCYASTAEFVGIFSFRGLSLLVRPASGIWICSQECCRALPLSPRPQKKDPLTPVLANTLRKPCARLKMVITCVRIADLLWSIPLSCSPAGNYFSALGGSFSVDGKKSWSVCLGQCTEPQVRWNSCRIVWIFKQGGNALFMGLSTE